MSGYTSMGSVDTICTGGGEDLHVWRTPQVVISHHDNLEDTRSAEIVFKSSFAKELEVKSATESFIKEKLNEKEYIGKCSPCNASDLDSDRRSLVNREEEAVVLTHAVKEFIRVKEENQRLKVKMKTFNQEDQRYKKLELEVDHLTWQLSKVFYRNLYFKNLLKLFKDGAVSSCLRRCNTSVGIFP